MHCLVDRNEGLTGIIVIFLSAASQDALASTAAFGGSVCFAMASLRNPASVASYSTAHQLS